MHPLLIETAADLDAAACLEVADGRMLDLAPGMLAALRTRRDGLLERLASGGDVYGVTTGMGAASTIRLDADAQSRQQENLMLARAIGSAPWLSVHETRAVLVVRLATFLTLDAGVSPELCACLVDMLNGCVHPAIPSTRLGAAGEIIPLAHLGGAITGSGRLLAATAADSPAGVGDTTVDAPRRLTLGPKEGVALIEGVPVTTGLALLRARDARTLVTQITVALAAELAITGASRDPYRAEVARGDGVFGEVSARILSLAGPEGSAAALQAPLSFRVAGPALASVLRAAGAVEAAASRALIGVTDSPAFVGDRVVGDRFVGDRFVGTAGFDGFDLASTLDALRVAVTHVAEVSAARLHRLLDDRFTGLPRQLSARPGLHAGMVTVHKRAVGVVHELVRTSAPASLGAIETSLGQEDVQSFSVSAAVAAGVAFDGARDVLACELLAVVQARRLGGAGAGGAGAGDPVHPAFVLVALLDAALPAGTTDRPFGRDIDLICGMLDRGWAI